MTKKAGKHLTLSERLNIQEMLKSGKKLKVIALVLGRDPRGIAYEVREHRRIVGKACVECMNAKDCRVRGLCGIKGCKGYCKYCTKRYCIEYCPHYEKGHPCKAIRRFPYVCNGCEMRKTCRLPHYQYDARIADNEYKKNVSESKCGIRLSDEELKKIDSQIYNDVKENGQSVEASVAKNPTARSVSSIYSYIHKGKISTKTIDLPRAAGYKVRKKLKAEYKVNYDYLEGRRIEDLGVYLMENPGTFFWQMDTVEGRSKDEAAVLTLLYSACNLQLMFRINSVTQAEVICVFREIRSKLGASLFSETFSVILTDNGPEFKDPLALETDPETGEKAIRIFFCHPQSSNEKAECENNHSLIRRIVPKGTCWIPYTQDDINYISLMINNYVRPMLNYNSPYQVADGILNKKVLELNNLKYVASNEVKLKPFIKKF